MNGDSPAEARFNGRAKTPPAASAGPTPGPPTERSDWSARRYTHPAAAAPGANDDQSSAARGPLWKRSLALRDLRWAA